MGHSARRLEKVQRTDAAKDCPQEQAAAKRRDLKRSRKGEVMSLQAGLQLDYVDGTLPSTRLASRRRSKFYFGMAVAMSVVVFVGFGPSFYLSAYFGPRLGIIPPVSSWPPLLILHGLVFSSWMVMLMLQTALAARGQVQSHRRLGIAGAALAALLVVVGVAAQRAQTHRMLSTGEFDTNFGLGPGVFFGANLSMILFGCACRRCNLFAPPSRDAQTPDAVGDDSDHQCRDVADFPNVGIQRTCNRSALRLFLSLHDGHIHRRAAGFRSAHQQTRALRYTLGWPFYPSCSSALLYSCRG